MPRLVQGTETNGSQVETDREPGHHKKIKETEAIWGIQDHITNVTERIIQKTEHTETLWEVTEIRG